MKAFCSPDQTLILLQCDSSATTAVYSICSPNKCCNCKAFEVKISHQWTTSGLLQSIILSIPDSIPSTHCDDGRLCENRCAKMYNVDLSILITHNDLCVPNGLCHRADLSQKRYGLLHDNAFYNITVITLHAGLKNTATENIIRC